MWEGGGEMNLTFTGKRNKQRFEVLVDGSSLWLTPVCHRYLLTLAHARCFCGYAGWIGWERFGEDDNVPRYMYRLAKELGWRLVENDRRRNYRLRDRVHECTFDVARLRQCEDGRVSGLFVGIAEDVVVVPLGMVSMSEIPCDTQS